LDKTAFKVNKFQKESSNLFCTIMQSIQTAKKAEKHGLVVSQPSLHKNIQTTTPAGMECTTRE